MERVRAAKRAPGDDPLFALTPEDLNTLWEKEKAQSRIQANPRDSTIPCCVTTRKTDNGYARLHIPAEMRKKYPSMPDYGNGGKNNMRVFAHRLVLLATGRRPERSTCDASHLCGNASCIEPTHLVWERHPVNMDRHGCHVHGWFEVCPHTPPCLARVPFQEPDRP